MAPPAGSEQLDDPRGGGPSRRRFLGLVGVAGTALAASTFVPAAAAGAAPPLPAGYRFHRVVVPGHLTHGLGHLKDLHPVAMLNDAGLVLVHATRHDGRRGVHALQLDWHDHAVSHAWTVVEEGQRLHDGRVVNRIYCGDLDPEGTYVAVIGAKGEPPAVYAARRRERLRRVVRFNDRVPGGGRFGGHFGDVDIDHEGRILLVAAYSRNRTTHQGVFLIDDARVDSSTRILVRTGQTVPGTDSTLTGFGLLDASGTRFVVQATARTAGQMRDQSLRTEPTVVFRGDLDRPAGKLLAASDALQAGSGPVTGESIIGPRIGPRGSVAHVVATGDQQSLHVQSPSGGQLLSSTGALGSSSQEVVSLSPGTFGPRDLVYYREIHGDKTMTMVVSNGSSSVPLLSNGDHVDGWAVGSSYFGFHPEQVDRRGRMAFVADFPSRSRCLVIGEPLSHQNGSRA